MRAQNNFGDNESGGMLSARSDQLVAGPEMGPNCTLKSIFSPDFIDAAQMGQLPMNESAVASNQDRF